MTTGEDKPLYNELHEPRPILKHVESSLEERLISIEEPLPNEIEAIKEYENNKKKGKTELISLNDLLKEKD